MGLLVMIQEHSLIFVLSNVRYHWKIVLLTANYLGRTCIVDDNGAEIGRGFSVGIALHESITQFPNVRVQAIRKNAWGLGSPQVVLGLENVLGLMRKTTIEYDNNNSGRVTFDDMVPGESNYFKLWKQANRIF